MQKLKEKENKLQNHLHSNIFKLISNATKTPDMAVIVFTF